MTENALDAKVRGPRPGLWGRWGFSVLVILWVGVVVARILGPSDLNDKEQPRTTSYTVDMIKTSNWIMPHDTFGIPATKPPLYNWMSVPFVMAAGYIEWALKLPSILASGVVVVVLFFFARRMRRRAELPADSPAHYSTAGIITAMIWLASPVTVKLLYVARPDMLLTACLTGVWFAATILIQAQPNQRRLPAALVFWFCTLLAALDKGPLALFGPIYLILAALVIRRDWRVLLKTGWWWGIPLVLMVMGAWTLAARQQQPDFFSQVLLGREMADRVAGPSRFFETFFNGPGYLISRFLPWSLVVIIALWKIGPRRWFSHPLAPAILWLIIWVVIFSFATTKRPDRYAPVYPALAVIAAWFLLCELNWRRLTPACIAIAAALIIVGLMVFNQFFSDGAQKHLGDNVAAFAKVVAEKTHGEKILFLDGEQSPLETLLGNVQPDPPDEAMLRDVEWVIRMAKPEEDEIGRVAISEPIAQIDGQNPGRLGLYIIAFGEGPEEYQNTRNLAVLYDDGTGKAKTIGTAQSARSAWMQFWRLHRPIVGTDATSPATLQKP